MLVCTVDVDEELVLKLQKLLHEIGARDQRIIINLFMLNVILERVD